MGAVPALGIIHYKLKGVCDRNIMSNAGRAPFTLTFTSNYAINHSMIAINSQLLDFERSDRFYRPDHENNLLIPLLQNFSDELSVDDLPSLYSLRERISAWSGRDANIIKAIDQAIAHIGPYFPQYFQLPDIVREKIIKEVMMDRVYTVSHQFYRDWNDCLGNYLRQWTNEGGSLDHVFWSKYLDTDVLTKFIIKYKIPTVIFTEEMSDCEVKELFVNATHKITHFELCNNESLFTDFRFGGSRFKPSSVISHP